MTSTSLAEIKNQYKEYNLLLPTVTEVQINPFYKYTISEVKADLSEGSGDIFKVGNVKTGYDSKNKTDIYVDAFSPTKPLLLKLATAAGIQFDPTYTTGGYVSKNCYRAKAYGAIRLPDGTGKTHADEKVINLDDEEDRLRGEFMEKSVEGIKEWRSAKAAEKLFAGDWISTGEKNDHGYDIKKYVIAETERSRYVEHSVKLNMALLRKSIAEKAMTGAVLRVVRALLGMKGSYTKAELAKPFVIPAVTFSPDYTDPEVRHIMLLQGMNAVSNMFGSGPMSPAPAAVYNPPVMATNNFEPEIFPEESANVTDQEHNPTDEEAYASPQMEPEVPAPAAPPKTPECSVCGSVINENVYDYSLKRHGRPLCYSCQKGGKQ